MTISDKETTNSNGSTLHGDQVTTAGDNLTITGDYIMTIQQKKDGKIMPLRGVRQEQLGWWGAQTSFSSSSSTAEEGQDLLLHSSSTYFSYTAAAAALSSSASFVFHDSSQVSADPFQHSFPVQPAGICPLLLSPQHHLPSCPTSPTRMSTWRSERRRELIISSHLISFHRVLFRNHQIFQKWVIQLSCQISNSPMFKSLLQKKNIDISKKH